MPLNLMTLTGEAGAVHINPAQIESVEPRKEGGSIVTLNSGKKFTVTDPADRIVTKVNTRAPDGF
jgi:uncharacterized protein YlzI (FlbEa/FlbD family)